MTYVTKIKNGRVSLYDASNGLLKRTIGNNGAVSAVIQGDTVAITMSNGKVMIYNADNGLLKRTI